MARRRAIRHRRPLPVLLAVFLVAVVLVLAYQWREQRRGSLARGADTPLTVAAAPIDPRHDGLDVQVSGRTSSVGALVDPVFGLSTDGIALVRRVEMLQWRERKDATGAAVYVREWAQDVIDSSAFIEAATHANPPRMPFESTRIGADAVRLGDFLLDPAILSRLAATVEAVPASVDTLPPNLAASFSAQDNALHTAADPQMPEIGDIRVRFERVPHQRIRVQARQSGRRLVPMPQPGGGSRVEVRLETER